MVALIALNPNDESKNTIFTRLHPMPAIWRISSI